MKINVSPEEFAGIVMIYLLDKINNLEEIKPYSEEFEKIWDKLSILKPLLVNYYLNCDINNRIFYKRIRDAFQKEDFSKDYVVNIINKNVSEEYKDDDIEEKEIINENELEFFKTKEVVKKVVNLINKRRFYKGTYLSEKELNKIIEKVLKEEK